MPGIRGTLLPSLLKTNTQIYCILYTVPLFNKRYSIQFNITSNYYTIIKCCFFQFFKSPVALKKKFGLKKNLKWRPCMAGTFEPDTYEFSRTLTQFFHFFWMSHPRLNRIEILQKNTIISKVFKLEVYSLNIFNKKLHELQQNINIQVFKTIYRKSYIII